MVSLKLSFFYGVSVVDLVPVTSFLFFGASEEGPRLFLKFLRCRRLWMEE